jgi:Ricin-type beta-trefoil lectin domain-like
MASKMSRLLTATICLSFASFSLAQAINTSRGVQYAVKQNDNGYYWTVFGAAPSLDMNSEPWAPGPSQTWILDSSGSPSGVIQAQIINSASGYCVEMAGCGSGYGTGIEPCASPPGPFQMWQIDTNTDGTYVIWSVGCGISGTLNEYPDYNSITLVELDNPNDVHVAATSVAGTTTISLSAAISTMTVWAIFTSACLLLQHNISPRF